MTARHPVCCILVLILAFLLTPRCVCAEGREEVRRGDDLEVTIDSRWAGCANGGYYPIRFRVVNRGPQRLLTFSYASPGSYNPVPRVERSIAIDQNATMRFTLPVPMVGQGTYGNVTIYDNGRELEQMSRNTVSLPDVNFDSNQRPALIVISPTGVDCSAFEAAVTSLLPGASSSSVRYGSGRTEDHEVVPSDLLPDSWISYSGIDLVAVAVDTLEKMSPQHRTALLNWVHQGGTLIVYNTGELKAATGRLNRLLGANAFQAGATEWQTAEPGSRPNTYFVQPGQDSNLADTLVSGVQRSNRAAASLPATTNAFWQKDILLGRVMAVPGNPFQGTARDWTWLLTSADWRQRTWTARHGITARRDSEGFFQFMIPGIKAVPANSFLVLISIFAIVIGPVNYWFLHRRRRLYLLVLTIPAIAFVTSVTLFAYSIVQHGISVRSRVRSLTVLDQGAKTAVTIARVALYAGLAPSEGLRFSPDTAVYPIWPKEQHFEYGTVDWTQTQALTSGWLPSRTRTQFLTVNHRAERGRLDIQAAVNDRLPVANGFEWDLQALIVTDDAGAMYFGSEIPAGASAQLVPATPEKLTAAAELVTELSTGPGPDVSQSSPATFFFGMPSPYYSRYAPQFTVNIFGSLMESRLMQLRGLRGAGKLPSRTYYAVFDDSPDVEIGLTKTRDAGHLHVVIGYY